MNTFYIIGFILAAIMGTIIFSIKILERQIEREKSEIKKTV